MKVILLFFLFNLFFIGENFCQNNFRYAYDILINVENYPSEDLFSGSDAVFLGIKNQDTALISLIFSKNDSILVAVDEINFDSEMLYSLNAHAIFSNDTIILESHFMRGIMNQSIFKVADFKLKFVGAGGYDLNEKVYEDAEKAILENNPLAYCQAYSSAQYYQDYPYRMIETLLWVDSLAAELIAKKELNRAVELFFSIEVDCFLATDSELAAIFSEDYLKVWLHGAKIYFQAEDYVKCENLCNLLRHQFPENAAIVLQLGDVYLKRGEKNDAKKYYEAYVSLMNEQGLSKNILKRVKKAIKK